MKLDTPALQRRYNREAQARHRGQVASPKTELENALLILAWEAVELSEGQVSAILDTDRVTVRKMREDFIARGMAFAEAAAHARLQRPIPLRGQGGVTESDASAGTAEGTPASSRPDEKNAAL